MPKTCDPKPRTRRAFEGAAMGAVVGLLGGILAGGLWLTIESGAAPIIIGLGIFGFSTVANTVITAAPPTC